ncbi:MAG TPA: hypothetical protein PKM65_20410 [Spirochaetota bacterium]|nr:hypothetical protein [Spirochaetota bacterium]
MKKILRGFGRIIKSFFYSGDHFQPVYAYTAIFLGQIVWLIQLKIAGSPHVSDALVLGMFGGILGLLAVYNWYKKGQNGAGTHEKAAPDAPRATETGADGKKGDTLHES